MNVYDSSKQNGRCISVPSGNIFNNFFNSSLNLQSFTNSPMADYNTCSNLNQTVQKKRGLINE